MAPEPHPPQLTRTAPHRQGPVIIRWGPQTHAAHVGRCLRMITAANFRPLGGQHRRGVNASYLVRSSGRPISLPKNILMSQEGTFPLLCLPGTCVLRRRTISGCGPGGGHAAY
eukprot:1158883-Pelagomonas_calceolata.AAC.14